MRECEQYGVTINQMKGIKVEECIKKKGSVITEPFKV